LNAQEDWASSSGSLVGLTYCGVSQWQFKVIPKKRKFIQCYSNGKFQWETNAFGFLGSMVAELKF
jgi:hypothetical protein